MTEAILEKLALCARYVFLLKFKKLEREIGFKLVFRNIPDNYINGWVSCDMTSTWKKAGLAVEKGANYFTMGHVVNGDSHRFDPDSTEYQSWLGGYVLKLSTQANWTPEEYFKLAIADQNSWLKHYGDPNPMTSVKGWNLVSKDKIRIDKYSGHLFEFGCTTHDDVGRGYKAIKLRLASIWMATLFNLSNPRLKLKGRELRPRISDNLYKRLKLSGYVAIFDVTEKVKVMLYGNGFIDEVTHADTFAILKDNLLAAMTSCDIVGM
ncbi:MAG: hypothetical protein AAB784_02560 [Patescibacteria group bacterium]